MDTSIDWQGKPEVLAEPAVSSRQEHCRPESCLVTASVALHGWSLQLLFYVLVICNYSLNTFR